MFWVYQFFAGCCILFAIGSLFSYIHFRFKFKVTRWIRKYNKYHTPEKRHDRRVQRAWKRHNQERLMRFATKEVVRAAWKVKLHDGTWDDIRKS